MNRVTPLGGGPEQYAYFETLRSRECVINLPTTDLVNEVIGIGNCSGAEVDKFEAFGLTPAPAANVRAPLIKECYANFECRLSNASLISKYNLFIWEVVKAHVASSPKYPKTVPDRGQASSRSPFPRSAYVKNSSQRTCETICSSTRLKFSRVLSLPTVYPLQAAYERAAGGKCFRDNPVGPRLIATSCAFLKGGTRNTG